MQFFSLFFFNKLRKNGRSFGRITVRHRGNGYFKKFSKNIQKSTFTDYRIFTFLRLVNFSGTKMPIFVYLTTLTKYVFFTHRFFSNFAVEHELSLKSFFALKLSKLKTVLDDEFKPFSSSVYITNFLSISNAAFIRILNVYPFSTFQYARSKGVYARFLKTRGANVVIKLPSGAFMNFSKLSSFICFGYKTPQFSLTDSYLPKAGYARNLGIRPHVRGVAINPVDHPHGGRTGESRPSVSPWAKLTKGRPTVFHLYQIEFVYHLVCLKIFHLTKLLHLNFLRFQIRSLLFLVQRF